MTARINSPIGEGITLRQVQRYRIQDQKFSFWKFEKDAFFFNSNDVYFTPRATKPQRIASPLQPHKNPPFYFFVVCNFFVTIQELALNEIFRIFPWIEFEI